MGPVISLPRLAFGAGSLAILPAELDLLGVKRPLLVSDRGLERAGAVAAVAQVAPSLTTRFLDIPENPTAAGVDGALAAYREHDCDGVIAVGGGSVLDSAKIVAALAGTGLARATELIGTPGRIGRVAPLIAIPTTLGTGSESSPVSALHIEPGGPAIGTRHPRLVPMLAVCDPDLTDSLPVRLVAATGIDALSHCVEGFFAEPANPMVDALALDGATRVVAAIAAARTPDGREARASLMAAAFAGGAAIHKGLGPAHAVALVCGDQHIHHGTLIGVALPVTTRLLARHVPDKADRLAAAMGLASGADLGAALRALIAGLGLPLTLRAAGYRLDDADALVAGMVASHFNRTSPYIPSSDEYRAILAEIAG